MFFDWLEIEQTFDQPLPLLDGNAYLRLVVEQGEVVQDNGIASPAYSHKGSFCDSVLIRASGNVAPPAGAWIETVLASPCC